MQNGKGGTSLHDCSDPLKFHPPERGPLTSLFSRSRPPNLVSCLTFPGPLSSPLSIFSPCGRKFSNFSKKILFFLIQYVKLAVKGSNHATSNCYVHCWLNNKLNVGCIQVLFRSLARTLTLGLTCFSTWVLTLKETFCLGSTDLPLELCPYFFSP